MSQSLLQMFPGLKYRDIRVQNIEARFTATLAAGVFNFGTASTFATYTAFDADPSKYYYLDYLNVSSTLNEADFIDAVNVSFNPVGFSFLIWQELQGQSVFLKPFTFGTFRQNAPMNAYFGTNRGRSVNQLTEPIEFRLRGSLNQTAAITLLALNSISVLIQTTIYEISNTKWIGENFSS